MTTTYVHTFTNLNNEQFVTHIDLDEVAAIQYPIIDNNFSKSFFRITFRGKAKPVECVYTEAEFNALVAAWRENRQARPHAMSEIMLASTLEQVLRRSFNITRR
jgi:hypothetical protein